MLRCFAVSEVLLGRRSSSLLTNHDETSWYVPTLGTQRYDRSPRNPTRVQIVTWVAFDQVVVNVVQCFYPGLEVQ